jgi:hypothetical protein
MTLLYKTKPDSTLEMESIIIIPSPEHPQGKVSNKSHTVANMRKTPEAKVSASIFHAPSLRIRIETMRLCCVSLVAVRHRSALRSLHGAYQRLKRTRSSVQVHHIEYRGLIATAVADFVILAA